MISDEADYLRQVAKPLVTFESVVNGISEVAPTPYVSDHDQQEERLK